MDVYASCEKEPTSMGPRVCGDDGNAGVPGNE